MHGRADGPECSVAQVAERLDVPAGIVRSHAFGNPSRMEGSRDATTPPMRRSPGRARLVEPADRRGRFDAVVVQHLAQAGDVDVGGVEGVGEQT